MHTSNVDSTAVAAAAAPLNVGALNVSVFNGDLKFVRQPLLIGHYRSMTLTGAEAVVDFVGEAGVIPQGIAMLRNAGSYFVIGYGEDIVVPTIDVISREINFLGNFVGSYNDLDELMKLTAQGKVTLHTSAYPLDGINDAMADLDHGRLQGRGILVPAGA